MLTIVILTILLAIAIPSFTNIAGKSRLKSAAERISTELQYARSRAIAQNSPVRVQLTTGASWCVGLDDDLSNACDCANTPAACTINGQQQVINAADFDLIEITGSTIGGNDLEFDNVRGLPDGGGDLTFQNEEGQEVKLRLSQLGSVNLCSPSGTSNIPDYVVCP